MKVRKVLDKFEFSQTDENEFEKDGWTVRLDFPNFELFSYPEIDIRYYFGSMDNLENYLTAIK